MELESHCAFGLPDIVVIAYPINIYVVQQKQGLKVEIHRFTRFV